MIDDKTFKEGETQMAQKKDTSNHTELLLKCMAEPDPMLSILE